MAILSPLRAPTFFPGRLSQYVPAMQYASDLAFGNTCRVSLGIPAAAATASIVAAVALTSGAVSYTPLISVVDAPFGRNVSVTLSNAANTAHLVTITGRDYLGQRMQETIQPLQNATVYGMKAFKYIDAVANATGTGTANISVGTGPYIGMPYKCIKAMGEEFADSRVVIPADKFVISQQINQTDLLAPTVQQLRAPCQGFVSRIDTVVQVQVTTGGTLTVGSAGTAVPGVVATVANSATVGTMNGGAATNLYQQSGICLNNGVITITPASFASAGAVTCYIEIQPAGLILPDLTDPQTLTTRDPRGLYYPYSTIDGVSELTVEGVFDNIVNASNNGGLHGIKHYTA